MSIKDVRQTPMVAKSAPQNLAVLYPMYVEQLIEIGPGEDSAMVTKSRNSSFSKNFFLFTNSFSKKLIMAYPPPNVNKPILNMVKNNDSKVFVFFHNFT